MCVPTSKRQGEGVGRSFFFILSFDLLLLALLISGGVYGARENEGNIYGFFSGMRSSGQYLVTMLDLYWDDRPCINGVDAH